LIERKEHEDDAAACPPRCTRWNKFEEPPAKLDRGSVRYRLPHFYAISNHLTTLNIRGHLRRLVLVQMKSSVQQVVAIQHLHQLLAVGCLADVGDELVHRHIFLLLKLLRLFDGFIDGRNIAIEHFARE
jgi:hypothetical protein